MGKQYTKKEVVGIIKALGPKATKDIKNSTVCSLVGHSHITTACLGFHYCARCGEQVGDSLGGCYSSGKDVIVGHDCSLCRTNYAKLGWKDKYRAPNPFPKKRKPL